MYLALICGTWMGRWTVRNQQTTVTATRSLKVTKRRACACVVCILFSPKVKPSKGKKKGKKKKRRPNEHRTPSCTLTVSRTRTDRASGHSHGHGHGRGSGHEERAKSYARPPALPRPVGSTDDTSATRGGRGRFVVQCVTPSLSSQGFFEAADADVKEGDLLWHHVSERAMHEEVIPDIEDAKHFTIGAGQRPQNLHLCSAENLSEKVSKVRNEGYHFALEITTPRASHAAPMRSPATFLSSR